MINGLEGIPGSGKSYEAVVFHVLHALKSGRLVITNLPLNLEAFLAIDPSWVDLIEFRTKPMPVLGSFDAERVPAFELFPPGEVAAVQSDLVTDGSRVLPRPKAKVFGRVWDYYSTWKHANGTGPLFVIDECHEPLSKAGADTHVVEWFKKHRHFNADVLLMTPGFRRMDQEIAELMGMVIRVRKADILGRKDSYIRKVHAGYRGAVISTDERKYLPQYFGLYKSHTQGNSVAESAASDVMPMSVKLTRFTRVFAFLVLCFCVYAFWPSDAKPVKSVKAAETKPAWLAAAAAERKASPPCGPEFSTPCAPGAVASAPASPMPLAVASAPGLVGPVVGGPVLEAVEDANPEPFRGQGVHLTGWMRAPGRAPVFTFVVSSSGNSLFGLTLVEILKSGYTFEPLGECAGLLRHGKKVRTVICDAPIVASGRAGYPVVLAGAAKAPTVSAAELPTVPPPGHL